MQTVSAPFDTASKATTRRPIGRSYISWTKQIDPSLRYFTVGDSHVGGADYIRGVGNPIEDSPVYAFVDESNNLISLEIDRFADGVIFSVAKAVADIVLDNNSDRYTPSGGSDIQTLIRPRRVIKLKTGFSINGDPQVVQNFIGVALDRPKLDSVNKTVSIEAVDFSTLIWEATVKNTVMFVDVTADEIIATLLDSQNIASSLYSLEVGANVIPFAYFEKGDNIGNIITKLCEAEMARFYVDELGIFRFQTRDSWNKAPYTAVVVDLTDSMVINQKEPDVSTIVNKVVVTGHPREVADRQLIYQIEAPQELAPGVETDIFVNLPNPVYTADTPAKFDENSYYKAGFTIDGDDVTATEYVDLAAYYIFSNAIKLTFRNNSTATAYLTQLRIWGEPAVIIGGEGGIQALVTDQTSVDEFGLHEVAIDNDYIQSDDYATSFANILLADRSDISSYLVLTIKGLPQLQLGDRVTRNGLQYNIVRNKLRLTADEGLTQELTIVHRAVESYFRIEESAIAGTDIIAP